MAQDLTRYLRMDKLPHIWCAGCGHGIVTQAIVRAVAELGIAPDKVTVVSGIGCSSRAPGYLNFDTLHTTHGRAIPFATGLKLARPELKVIVITGDGDAAAIGGNHLIHAARRNIDMTVVCFNNSIYAMTSGQYSPLTPQGSLATTAPYGMVERPFDLCELVMGAGGTFVARSTAYHARHLTNVIKQAITHKGFAFVDALSECPTYFGRRNNMRDALTMLYWYRDNATSRDEWDKIPPAERGSRFPIGVFRDEDAPEYCETYRKMMEKAMGEGNVR